MFAWISLILILSKCFFSPWNLAYNRYLSFNWQKVCINARARMPENFQSLLGDRKTLHTIDVSENNTLIREITNLIFSFVPRNEIWADFEKNTHSKIQSARGKHFAWEHKNLAEKQANRSTVLLMCWTTLIMGGFKYHINKSNDTIR